MKNNWVIHYAHYTRHCDRREAFLRSKQLNVKSIQKIRGLFQRIILNPNVLHNPHIELDSITHI